MEPADRTLYNNEIKKFILKIDFVSNDVNAFASLVNKISKHFTRLEQRTHINYNINVDLEQDKEEVQRKQTPDFVLIDEGKSLNLTFSTFQNALIIDLAKYVNNTSYKECLKIVTDAIIELALTIQCKRIGMRYINSFHCKTPKEIIKVLSKDKAKILSGICQENQLSRMIVQEEYNTENSKLRLQYGVPNKYYPAVMTTYDVLLDIDSYDDSTHPFEEWDEVIKNLNHMAYGAFVKSMNSQYIESLK
jgi:uncharacterized protein (TIGR04255 family)